MTKKKNRIVCAAVKIEGVVVAGRRHYDPIMTGVIESIWPDSVLDSLIRDGLVKDGFIDARGVYLDRYEAWVVADSAGQIIYDKGKCDGELFSEHLY